MANRYWVGGDGTWDTTSTTNWSDTSGGAGGASVPTSGDVAIFNASSGGGTITLGATVDCLTINLTGFTGTFDFNFFDVNVVGNAATVVNVTSTIAAITRTGKFNCTYSGSTGTRTIVISTGDITKAVNLSISNGSDAVVFSGAIRLSTLTFTGFSGTWAAASTVNIGNSLVLSSDMTVDSIAGSITFSSTATGNTITTNGKTIDQAITFNGVGGSWQLQDNLTVGSTRTVTLTNGTLDLNNKTLSCGLFSSNNSNTRSIAFGTGNITLTGSSATIFNGTGSSSTAIGFTGTPTVNCTYAGSTGTRTISGGSRTVLTESQVFNFNITAGSDTVSFPNANAYGNLDFTGFTGALTTGTDYFYGDVKLASGQSWTATTSAIRFAATSAKQITTSGITIDSPLNFNGIGGTWSFADALTQGSTKAFTIANGTVKLKAGATSTVGAFATSGSTQKYLQSTAADSQATLSQASGTVNASYLTIKDINATGGATWNAYRSLNNVDAGNNTGWDFLNAPVTTTTLAMRLGFGL
jgi:hypothetical protein